MGMGLRGLFIFAILLISLISFTRALSTDIKEEYKGLETVIVKIEGNIIEPLSKSQIEFKRKNVLVPFEFDVKKIYQTNYIWFITPKIENLTNYTLIIKDAVVSEYGVNKKVDLYVNFSVKPNLTDYYINPGFISSKENYIISVSSNLDVLKKISVDFPVKKELSILPGKSDFEFNIEEIDNSIFRIVKFGDYNLPVYIINEGKVENTQNNTLSISPQEINIEREIGSKKLEYSFKIINTGANKIEDIALEYDDKYMKITPDSKIDLESGGEILYNITLEDERNISEVLRIYSNKNNISRELNLDIRFTNFYTPINYTLVNQSIENNNSKTYYCQELGGKECYDGQKCTGQTITTKDDVSCCIGTCSLLNDNKENSSWIGYLIIAGAIIAIVFAFIKYKKVKPSKNLLEKTLESEITKTKLP